MLKECKEMRLVLAAALNKPGLIEDSTPNKKLAKETANNFIILTDCMC